MNGFISNTKSENHPRIKSSPKTHGTKAKYGEHFATRFVRLHRLDHPSSLEQIIMNWLDCQGVGYEREFWLDCGEKVYLVDFVICAMGKIFAVEVNGSWAHSHHTERDSRKLAALRDCGFDVIVVDEADVLNGAFIPRLDAALASSLPQQALSRFAEAVPATQ